jgi:hypothetical protein
MSKPRYTPLPASARKAREDEEKSYYKFWWWYYNSGLWTDSSREDPKRIRAVFAPEVPSCS